MFANSQPWKNMEAGIVASAGIASSAEEAKVQKSADIHWTSMLLNRNPACSGHIMAVLISALNTAHYNTDLY